MKEFKPMENESYWWQWSAIFNGFSDMSSTLYNFKEHISDVMKKKSNTGIITDCASSSPQILYDGLFSLKYHRQPILRS